jgi:hypothetical protein
MSTTGQASLTLSELFDRFTSAVFRLEARQQYLVPQEEEELQRFLRGEPRGERSIRTHEWTRRVAESTLAGRRWQRVRLIEHPLSNYSRFELFGLLGNSACGDETRFAVLDEHPELAELVGQDYWLFDHDTPSPAAGLMRYDDEGHFLGADVSTDPEVIARCQRWRKLALVHSISAHAYLMRYRPDWTPSPDDLLQPRHA